MMLVAMIILFRIFILIALLIGFSNSEVGSSIKEADTLTRCLIGCLATTYIASEFLVLWLKNDEV